MGYKDNRKRQAFTLAELLIVVAIIGVLVAVSIPVFLNQLEKAREVTDLSNLRSALGEAYYLSSEINWDTEDEGRMYYYDAQNGMLLRAEEGDTWDSLAESEKGYGKGTGKDAGCTKFRMAVAIVNNDCSIEDDDDATDTKCENADHAGTWAPDASSHASDDDHTPGYYDGCDEVKGQVIAVHIFPDGCLVLDWTDTDAAIE